MSFYSSFYTSAFTLYLFTFFLKLLLYQLLCFIETMICIHNYKCKKQLILHVFTHIFYFLYLVCVYFYCLQYTLPGHTFTLIHSTRIILSSPYHTICLYQTYLFYHLLIWKIDVLLQYMLILNFLNVFNIG